MLLEKGTVNVQGGEYDSAMQAALFRDHDQVVQMVLDQGADLIVQGGRYGRAHKVESCCFAFRTQQIHVAARRSLQTLDEKTAEVSLDDRNIFVL